MTEYNKYARQLDEAFKAARNEYNEIAGRYEAADREYRRVQNLHGIISLEETKEKVKAEGDYAVVSKEFEEAKTRIWPEFNKRRAEIGKELEAAIRENSLANPAKVDTAALELLKSGAMSAEDFASFADRYDDNPTMLKLISSYAKEAAERPGVDVAEHGKLLALSSFVKNGCSKVMRKWNDLCKTADYCSNQRHSDTAKNYGYTVIISNQWENIAEKAIEDF